MCGIVGFVSNTYKQCWKSKTDFIYRALFVDTLRGEDATGMFAVPFGKWDDEPLMFKKAIPAPDYLQMRGAGKMIQSADTYFAWVGHNRAATTGKLNNASAHPFQHEHITLVHNGTLDSRKGLSNNFAVDSEDICYSLAQTDDPKALLEQLDGAYALVWYNSKTQTFNLARNADRPLFFGFTESGNHMFFASEAWMLDAAVVGAFDVKTVYSLNPGNLMTISHTQENLKGYEVTEFTPYIAPNTHYHWPGDYGDMVPWHDGDSTLQDLGYVAGEFVKFRIHNVTLYNTHNKDKYGGKATITGATIPTGGMPSDPIVAYQISTAMLTLGMTYPTTKEVMEKVQGRIFDGQLERLSRYGGKGELIVKNVREVKYLTNVPDVEPEDVELEPEPELNNSDWVKGPAEDLIRVRKFNKLTKDGCCYCTADVLATDAEDISWTSDKQPICPDCTEVLQDDGEGATLQ